MPYIPVETDDEGNLMGVWPEVEEVTEAGQTYEVARTEIGGQLYSSEWYQYCGRQQSPGVQPSADQNNQFLAVADPDYEWQADEVEAGEPLNVTHFEDYESWGNGIGSDGVGKPTQATWRSEDVPDDQKLSVTVIRSPLVEEKAEADGEVGEWFSAASSQGVIAYLNVCTHFCCVPGYKLSDDASIYDVEDGVYCQCHQSRYDPFSPEFGTFNALPRPE